MSMGPHPTRASHENQVGTTPPGPTSGILTQLLWAVPHALWKAFHVVCAQLTCTLDKCSAPIGTLLGPGPLPGLVLTITNYGHKPRIQRTHMPKWLVK